MQAPDKIYMPNELLSEEWQRHIKGQDTEYVRKDAFLEKAVKFLENEIYDYVSWEGEIDEELVFDFKRYMNDGL